MAMEIDTEYTLCWDCMSLAVNDELPADSTPERDREITEGLAAIPGHPSPTFDVDTGEGYTDFAGTLCDACRTRLAGPRYIFATLKATD